MNALDESSCNVCFVKGCVSWAFGEGFRCFNHSTYTGPTRDRIQKEFDAKYAIEHDGLTPKQFADRWFTQIMENL